MRIGIDARFNRSPGVERYYSSLIKNLLLIDKRNEYVVYYPSLEHLVHNRIDQKNVNFIVLPAHVYSFHEQFLLAYRIRKDQIDVFHATNSWVTPIFCPCPLVVTIHDMCPRTHPELIKLKARTYSKFMLPYAVWGADKILTVSEYSKKEIVKFYPQAEQKIWVTYNGVDPIFREAKNHEEIETTKKSYGIEGKYILYIGAIMKHKNILGLISAYKQLPSSLKSRYMLLIIGRKIPDHDEIFNEVLKATGGETIQLIQFVRQSDLPFLYSGATAFVFPSKQEGFGIPLVEAMASRLPIVSSNCTVMPEICGGAAIYFSPESLDSMKNAIEQILTDKDLREKLSNIGFERSKQFSWNISARKTLNIYEEAYKQK
jgi:glycosyltransferase involved in cell wall biosynthesis